ncbi:MAG: hypothetical protein ACI4JM_07530 [Oscillospiraceae bacterium]
MNKNKAESVIRETIEYANKEIEKHKKKTFKGIMIAICCLSVLVVAYLVVFRLETPVRYNESIITVNVPEDKGLDININLNNYKSAKGILVKTSDNTFDLYLGLTQTLYTRATNSDTRLIRANNDIIVDYNSDKLIGFMPEESSAENIMNIYYVDNFTDEVMYMDDSELINYEKKTLIWTR